MWKFLQQIRDSIKDRWFQYRIKGADVVLDVPNGHNLYVYDVRRNTLRLKPLSRHNKFDIGGGKRYVVAKNMRKAMLKVRKKEFVYDYE